MGGEYHRIVFVFADGVGLAAASETNPLATVSMPAIGRLLGGPLTRDQSVERPGLLLKGIDAQLGVPGLPQSATGQTTLLTGVNGARVMGRHVTALPGPKLGAVLESHSVFRQLVEQGSVCTFANAYSPKYFELIAAGKMRASATTRAVAAGGLPFRTLEDLERGDAVTWDIERDLFQERTGAVVESVEAVEAGRHLAAISMQHELTLFETFLTDIAGHERWGVTAAEALGRLDRLIGGVLERLEATATLLLSSDHGNVEDATTRSHTHHPVPLLVAGPLASEFGDLTSIAGITPRIVEILGRQVPR